MKKVICPLLALSILLYTSPLKADSYTQSQPIADECSSEDESCECAVTPGSVETAEPVPMQATESQPVDQGTYADQESLVTPASADEESGPRAKQVRYIILAVVAVIVAVTAMLLVDSNEGHSHHHKKT
jgi:hypothetical protein